MTFDWTYFFELFLDLPKYIPITLLMAIISMFLSVILGAFLTYLQIGKLKLLRALATLYISLFRGVPTLVQLFLFFYGLPQLFPVFRGMSALSAAIIGLGMKQAAYLAEIFRAAVLSVDSGQLEAAQALNIPSYKAFFYITLPQAAVNALPGIGNTFVVLMKETSLAFTLGLTELFSHSKMVAGESFRYFETYSAVGLIYWGMVLIYTWLQGLIETELNIPYRRTNK